MTTTATRAAEALQKAMDTLLERDADYKGSDQMYAEVMQALFPDGIGLNGVEEQLRFHLFMLMIVKVTRYARNWDTGHPDSLTDLINYAAMLQATDATGNSGLLPVRG